MRFTHLVGSFIRYSRYFGLTNWTSYHDESYNSNAFCIGGWLARENTWKKLEKDWRARIDYENRKSAKKGFPPISRYHATDCANLKRDFDVLKGWSIERQIRLSKKLCGIVATYYPYGIVAGTTIEDCKYLITTQDCAERNKQMYRLSFQLYLTLLSQVMERNYPNDRVTVFYDRSKNFGPIVNEVWSHFCKHPVASAFAKRIVIVAPLGWEECIPLQPADLIAFEGLKRINTGGPDMRKSLTAILGKRTPLVIAKHDENAVGDLNNLYGWCQAAYDDE